MNSVRPPTFDDVHAHVDASNTPSLELAFDVFRSELRESGCSNAVALHLLTQPWDAVEWCEQAKRVPTVIPFVSIDISAQDAVENLRFLVCEHGARGLKLHPRLYQIPVNDPRTHRIVRAAGKLGIPVLMDAFFDWQLVRMGVRVEDFGLLAEACPETRICIAHMAAPYIHTGLMMARALPNVFLDTSFSTLYFRRSSLVQDICYGIWSLKGRKVLYGSDYPDRSMLVSVSETREQFIKWNVPEDLQVKVFSTNFSDFVGARS